MKFKWNFQGGGVSKQNIFGISSAYCIYNTVIFSRKKLTFYFIFHFLTINLDADSNNQDIDYHNYSVVVFKNIIKFQTTSLQSCWYLEGHIL